MGGFFGGGGSGGGGGATGATGATGSTGGGGVTPTGATGDIQTNAGGGALGTLGTLPAALAALGVPIAYSYEIDYTDMDENGAVKNLYTPAVGDVILAWWLDWNTHVNWDSADHTGTVYLGQGAGFDLDNTSSMGGIAGCGVGFGDTDFSSASAAARGDVDLPNPPIPTPPEGATPWVCMDTTPVRVVFGYATGPATVGHDRITLLVVKATA